MVTTIASFSTEAIYNLTIDEKSGVATRCTCKGHQYRGHCKHQDTFNQEVQRAATFILLQRMVQEKHETARAWREYAEMA